MPESSPQLVQGAPQEQTTAPARGAPAGAPAGSAVQVKICGLTNLADAELAAGLGAWALGMIFYADSPRRCSPEQAQLIAAQLRRRVQLCGVFVNAPLELIAATVDELALDIVQLHGDEGPAFCSEVQRRTGARVIKAAQVSEAADLRELERFHVDYHLLDARSKAVGREGMRGGTGETFDWELVRGRRSRIPLILSGGLTAHNVAEAIAVTRPYAIDSASGTESAPGHKDEQKLRALLDAVRSVASPAPAGEAMA